MNLKGLCCLLSFHKDLCVPLCVCMCVTMTDTPYKAVEKADNDHKELCGAADYPENPPIGASVASSQQR